MITEKTVILSACGVDTQAHTKSITKIETKYLHITTNEEEIEEEMTFDGPAVNIFRSLRYTMIDFQYTENTDYDFIRSVEMLKSFCTPENSIDTKTDIIPCVQITIMPKELKGQYYICGIHGTWCLMPSKPGILPDMIRFIFDNELVHVYQMNESHIDNDEIEAQLYAETQYEQM